MSVVLEREREREYETQRLWYVRGRDRKRKSMWDSAIVRERKRNVCMQRKDLNMEELERVSTRER